MSCFSTVLFPKKMNLVTLTSGTPLVSHRKRDSFKSMPPNLTPNEARSKVMEEILNTERDYVKHLDDIIEVRRGYPLRECNT